MKKHHILQNRYVGFPIYSENREELNHWGCEKPYSSKLKLPSRSETIHRWIITLKGVRWEKWDLLWLQVAEQSSKISHCLTAENWRLMNWLPVPAFLLFFFRRNNKIKNWKDFLLDFGDRKKSGILMWQWENTREWLMEKFRALDLNRSNGCWTDSVDTHEPWGDRWIKGRTWDNVKKQ